MGIVCMMSRIGVMNACTRSERDIQIPTGMPMAMAIRVETKMIASVRMVSSHMPR